MTRQKPFSYDSGLKDQIQRASVSVMSNIAEGMERGSNDELIYFLFIAKGSAGEVRAQLYVAEDQEYVSGDYSEKARKSAEAISRQLSAWIKSLQSPDAHPGPKFHKSESKAQSNIEKLWTKSGLRRLDDGRFIKEKLP